MEVHCNDSNASNPEEAKALIRVIPHKMCQKGLKDGDYIESELIQKLESSLT